MIQFDCNCCLRLSAIAYISLSLAAPCCASDKSDYEEALRLHDIGKNGEAARLLREVQRHRPNDTNVLVELGIAYMCNYNDLGSGTEKAEKCFLRAIELDPGLGKAYIRMSQLSSARGKFELAVKYATKGITAKTPDLEGYWERACALSNLKRDKQALTDIEVYIRKTSPVSRKVLLSKASILENLKDYDKALTEYRKLLKENYEDNVVYREVACLRSMNKPAEALKSLDKLLAHNGKDDIAYLSRARLLESIGKHKEAIADYSKVIDLQPAPSVFKERASVYEKMGRKDLADRDRREADRFLP